MAIKTYMVVHTGANSQGGGLNHGLFNPAYHPVISGRVKSEATKPMASVIARLMINGTG
jgi:hypothetical protein